MEYQDSFGRRLGRFLALVGGIFAITMGIVIAQRLSSDALAMLIGLFAGVLMMLPLGALGLLIWRREMKQRESYRSPQQANPPVVVVTPPALSGYGNPSLGANHAGALGASANAWQWAQSSQERQFTIVGGED
jgi:hypothetical protein